MILKIHFVIRSNKKLSNHDMANIYDHQYEKLYFCLYRKLKFIKKS